MKSAGRSALRAGAILSLVFCLATPAAAQKGEGAAARAAALQRAGKHSEAIPLAQHVLAIREKQLGPDDPDLVSAITRWKRSIPTIRGYQECWAGWVVFIYCDIAMPTPRGSYVGRR